MNQVIHGNCITELSKLQDNSVDLLLTDPPYGDDAAYGRLNRTIAGNSNPLIGLAALAASYRVLKRNRGAYFFLDIKHLPFIRAFVENYTDFTIKDWLVWDKTHMGMGHGFRKRHELILALEKGKPRYRNLGLPNVLPHRRIVSADHPHEKPLPLLEALIKQSTDPGELVIDPFAGSGSTALAAAQTGRRYLAIEREAKYITIARKRLAQAA